VLDPGRDARSPSSQHRRDAQPPSGSAAHAAKPWLGVQLRQLAALAAVAEEGSFRRAAVSLGYTQPAISQQVAALERLIGAQLVERGGGEQVRPTEFGKILLEHWQAIVSRLVAARADLDAALAGTRGALRLGVFESAGTRLLPAILSEHSARWPQVEVVLHDNVADPELLALVEAGLLELAFATLPLPAGELETLTLFEDPYVLVVRADSPLAAAGIRNRQSIAALPLVCFKDCRSTNQALLLLGEGRGPVTPLVRSNNAGLLQGLVRAGRGVALIPRLSFTSQHDLTAVDLGDLLPPRAVALAWHPHRTLPPAAASFVEIAARVCAGLV
jgi:DNA-binding transcriptional LysR family regulator